jgi:hypothetical protein
LCYVGIYGYDFVKAGKLFWDLVKLRGFTIIIQEDLIGSALALYSLCCAALTSVACYFILGPPAGYEFVVLIAFCIGLGITLPVVKVLDSGCATAITCFMEDPDALQTSHPGHFQEMMNGWMQVFPEEMTDAGYNK